MKDEEENILIESNKYFYYFNFINGELYISCYEKDNKKYLFDKHKIKDEKIIKLIHNTVDKESGQVFKKANARFLVRNHDKGVWELDLSTDKILVNDYKSSENNLYDTRNKTNTKIGKYMLSIKRMWVNGFGI